MTDLRRAGGEQLVQLEGERAGAIHDLGDSVLLGRGAEAGIHINDARVSRAHARIRRIDSGEYVIEDLGSANGTRVNGVPVQHHQLRVGDQIRLGADSLFVFVERDPVEGEMLRRRRLEDLGRMGVGIAHDLNNMLGAIGATLDFVDELPGETRLDQSEFGACLSDLRGAAAQAAELTGMLLGFVRGEVAEQREVDITAVCSRIVRLLGHVLDQSITVDHRTTEDALLVSGRGGELLQLILNLCLNARDAMPGGGTLGVSVERGMAVARGRHQIPQVRIAISDTGVGMDELTRKRVFEPFFSKKVGGQSTGLGLAIAQAVARKHGGRIEVSSVPGRGSTFAVFLPLAVERRATLSRTTDRPSSVAEPDPSLGRILVVDDEPIVRRSLSRLLARDGYEVIEAANGREALRLYESAARKPAVMLVDLDMPEMGGIELSRKLAEGGVEVELIFISGHLDRLVREVPSGARILPKPCERRELIQQVQAAMAAACLVEGDTRRTSVKPPPAG